MKGYKDTIDWYNNNASDYAAKTADLAALDLLNEFKNLVKKGKVLDAGCGGGRDTDILSKLDLDVIGLDISEGLIKVAMKTFPQCHFSLGSILKLPFENWSFNGIWSFASLVHFHEDNDVVKALSEFNRVLIKNGIVLISVKGQLGNQKSEVLSDEPSSGNRLFRYFTLEEIVLLIQSAGFKILRTDKHKKIGRTMGARDEIKWITLFAQKK